MKALKIIFVGLIFLQIGLILVANRALFASRFDEIYWKDRYEQSQWRLPVSSRVIGDDGLYLYEGSQLIKGANPLDFNAEVPPLGKYAIGLSVLLFGNGYIYGLLTMTAVLILFFVLSRNLLGNATMALGLTALVAMDPLITSQFALTMLDSLWLFFLILIFIMIDKLTSQKSKGVLFGVLGILLGLFCETKLPVLAPVLFLPLIFKMTINKQWKELALLFLGFLGGYLLPYIPYFFSGHSFSEWITAQKWIVAFYRMTRIEPTFGNVLTTLIANRYQDINSRSWQPVSEWSPLWPMITTAGIITSIFLLLKKNTHYFWKQIALFVIWVIAFYAIIPFSVRYLVILLPFLYLITGKILLKIKSGYIILLIFLTINFFTSLLTLFPTPQATANVAGYAIAHGYFQDLYEELDSSSKILTRPDFNRFGSRIYYDGEIENIKAQIWSNNWSRIKSPQKAMLNITFNTRHLGSFTENRPVIFIKENGRWKLKWQWDNLIEGLTQNSKLQTIVEEGRRGAIIDKDGRVLVEDFPSYMLWITPNKVNPATENAVNRDLEFLFDRKIPAVSIHNRYVENRQPDWPVPIGVIPHPIDEATKQKLLANPAISLTAHFGRIDSDKAIPDIGRVTNTVFKECCSLLYSAANYHGTEGPEAQYDTILSGQNGGKLILLDENGQVKRMLIKKTKSKGLDLYFN